MESVLVSACLLGQAVRYDGRDTLCDHPVLQRWYREGRIVAVCPEVAGGLPVPRPRSEIAFAAGNVLDGSAKVVDSGGRDVTVYFLKGAGQALEVAQERNIRIAILKEGSPSCGSHVIFDGSFTGSKVRGSGVTAAKLRQAGIHVFSEDEIAEAEMLLQKLETGTAA
ncbi:MAG: 2-thiouracil desulfurase family protein [Acidiferrobacterales bacterium]